MLNRVVLVGRITKEIEMKYSQGGKAYAKFTLAVNRQFKKDGEQQADFIQIAVFGKTAENTANFCRKGSLVGIDGRIQTGSYEGQDGKRVYTTEIMADNVQFLEPKSANNAPNGNGNTNGYQSQQNAPQGNYSSQEPFNPSGTIDDSDLPF